MRLLVQLPGVAGGEIAAVNSDLKTWAIDLGFIIFAALV
jgi:hypothetical protein